MNRKTLNILIPILSVIIFFVWGWIEGSYQHSWIISWCPAWPTPFCRLSTRRRKRKRKRTRTNDPRGGERLKAPRLYNFTLRW